MKPGSPLTCSALGKNSCRVAPLRCAEGGRPLKLSEESGALPYGFNDAASITGQLDPEADIQLQEVAGSSFVRLVLDWGRVESTPEAFDFSQTDEIYCAAAAEGIGTLFTVTGIPVWAAPEVGKNCTPDAACVQPPASEHLDP